MAAPVTHLYFADKFCDKHWKIDRFQFFAWNCLPDIRYIDNTIERTKYHIRDVAIHEVLEEKSDFWKGVKFHSFVDGNRGMFCRLHIYPLEIFDEIMVRALKFAEDDILYWKLLFRQDFVKFLSEYEFPVYDVNLQSIKKWKSILCDYFSVQPCKSSRDKFGKSTGLTEDTRIKIETSLCEFRWKYRQQINDMIAFIENNIE